MIPIKIVPLREGFKMPAKATKGSAAYDAYVPSDIDIHYGRQIIPLGFKLEMPIDIELDDRTRAGYAAKGIQAYDADGREFRIDADVQLGLIDSDYRGEVGAILIVRDIRCFYNTLHLKKHQEISQLLFQSVPDTDLLIVDSLSKTERGEKGFGAANGQ